MSRAAWILVVAALLCVVGFVMQPGPRRSTGQTVMVYTPFPVTIADKWIKPFENETGIHVEQIKEGTTRVYSRLRAEKSNPRADVWIGGGGMVPFITAANEGLLAPYRPKGWENMPEKRGNLVLRDAQWRWVGACIIGLGYAYNPSRLPPEELPKTWDDLADPKWKNEIIMWDPASSGTAMLFLQAALMRSIQKTGNEAAGWKYLKAVYENMPRYCEGVPSMMVSRNEAKIGIHFEHQVLEQLEQSSDPAAVAEAQKNLRWTILPDSPVIVDPIALVKNGPDQENGKRFIDFIMSHEGQQILNQLFFVQDPSFGPPQYLDYTLDQMSAVAMPLDVVWMGDNFNRARTRWQNDIEKCVWLWEPGQ